MIGFRGKIKGKMQEVSFNYGAVLAIRDYDSSVLIFLLLKKKNQHSIPLCVRLSSVRLFDHCGGQACCI